MGSTLSNYFSIDFEHRVPKQNCLYSQKINRGENTWGERGKTEEKFHKTCWGCFWQKLLVSKKSSHKWYFHCKINICQKNAVKIWKIGIFVTFSNLYKRDLGKIRRIRKWKWHFALKWSPFFLKKIFPLQRLHSAMFSKIADWVCACQRLK